MCKALRLEASILVRRGCHKGTISLQGDSHPKSILKFQPCNSFDYNRVHYKPQRESSLQGAEET